MKVTPVLPVVLLLALLATSAVQAQTTEKIALYADKFGTDCSIADTGDGLVSVYIVHVGTGARIGSEFQAPKPECWTGATWVGDEFLGYGVAGQSQGPSVSVAYRACLTLPVYVGKMSFEVTGAAQACCRYNVLPSLYEPASVISADCFSQKVSILGGSAVINENASCACGPPLAVELATWGRIKSLYH